MKRKSNKGGLSVSLFPFLTVLICTMGALIVMLVMAVNAASKEAEEKAAAAFAEQGKELQRQIDDVEKERTLRQVQFDGWLSKRSELVAENSRTRELKEYLESQIEELKRDRQSLAEQLAVLENAGAKTDDAATSQRLEELGAEVLRLESELANKNKLVAERPPETMYSVVPFSGANSTKREPIYIECTESKVIFQPLGIEMTEDDFAFDLRQGNPVEAALSTIRKYWGETKAAGENGTPYPLLIVRPNGGRMYALSRRAMTTWVDEFGYELIDDRLKLDFGEVDATLKEKVEAAVKEAKLEAIAINLQQKEVERKILSERMIAGGDSMSPSGGLQVDSVHGGFKKSPAIIAAARASVSTGRTSSQSTSSSEAASTTSLDEKEFSPRASPTLSSQFENNFQNVLRPNQASAKGVSKNGLDKSSNKNDFVPNNLAEASHSQLGGDGHSKSASEEGNAPMPGGESSLTGGTSTSTAPCLAEQRGKNWALPTTAGQTVALIRPVKFFCSADQLVIPPEFGTNDERVIVEMGASPTGECVSTLVREIHKKIETWGPAVKGGYWKPQLEIRVIPGGEQRFADLSRLLLESGLELKAQK